MTSLRFLAWARVIVAGNDKHVSPLSRVNPLPQGQRHRFLWEWSARERVLNDTPQRIGS